MIFTTLSSRLLICSSASCIRLFIPSSVFFISIFIFFTSDSFYIFYLFVDVLTDFNYSSPKFGNHVYDYPCLNPLSELLISISLSSFSEVLSFL